MLHFDTDYMEGAHPEVMRRLLETNLEQTVGYGHDPHTAAAKRLIKQACGLGEDAEVYLLVGGTQTNATVIDGLLSRHEGVIAADTGHINVHEAGAIEASGHKVLTIAGHDGKLRADDVERYIADFYRDDTFDHMVAPGMVYISYPTEYGTLYSLDELTALSRVCRSHEIPLYIDGARLAYGLAAAPDVTLRDIARLADVFYIGGTKCGALCGEAVVATRTGLLPHFFTLIKQHGALMAKGRVLGVQFETLFTDGLYTALGSHAVGLAMRIKEAFTAKGYPLVVNSFTNQQFFILPNEVIDRLSKNATFELWGPRGERETPVRFVTSWATRAEDVEALTALL